jgi:hypothetical protein
MRARPKKSPPVLFPLIESRRVGARARRRGPQPLTGGHPVLLATWWAGSGIVSSQLSGGFRLASVRVSSMPRVILCPGGAAVRSKSLPVPATPGRLGDQVELHLQDRPGAEPVRGSGPMTFFLGRDGWKEGAATHRNSGRIHHVAIRILAFRAARAAEHSQTTPFSRWSAR